MVTLLPGDTTQQNSNHQDGDGKVMEQNQSANQPPTQSSSATQITTGDNTSPRGQKRWTDGMDPEADPEPNDSLSRRVWKARKRLLDAEAEAKRFAAAVKTAEKELIAARASKSAQANMQIVGILSDFGLDAGAADQLAQVMKDRGMTFADLISTLRK